MTLKDFSWFGYHTPQNLFKTLEQAQSTQPTSEIADELFALLSHWAHDSDSALQMPNTEATKKWRCIVENEGFISTNEKVRRLSENQLALKDLLTDSVPFPAPKNPNFTFIDLFAGIGGFRMALQNLGGKCVFSSEWDLAAQQTYLALPNI